MKSGKSESSTAVAAPVADAIVKKRPGRQKGEKIGPRKPLAERLAVKQAELEKFKTDTAAKLAKLVAGITKLEKQAKPVEIPEYMKALAPEAINAEEAELKEKLAMLRAVRKVQAEAAKAETETADN